MEKFSTPMMKQYTEIKQRYSDCLLLFRLGDFYELFFEDAKIGSKILNITLTKRPRGKDGDIPMAGVPHHAVDIYLSKLIEAGYKVAMCEQLSEPNGRGIVERDVVRVITPGTVFDEKSLREKEHNYIMSFCFDNKNIGLAVADISTGDFQATQFPYQGDIKQGLVNELARFNPVECLVSKTDYQNKDIFKILKNQGEINISSFNQWEEIAEEAEKFLKKHFKIKTLKSFGLEDKLLATKSAATLLGYLKYTQKDRVDHIKRIRIYDPKQYLILDHSTVANLELFETIKGRGKKGSFIDTIDLTSTAMGGRQLRAWVRKPLIDRKEIEERLEGVEELKKDRLLRDKIKEILKQFYDMERIISRLSVGIGQARDLISLKQSLILSLELKSILKKSKSGLIGKIKKDISEETKKVLKLIDKNILDEPAFDLKKGGLIKMGVSKELDNLRSGIEGDKSWISSFEKKEIKKTGISSLKIKFNKIFGYYIEISKPNLHLVSERYVRKQTMVNGERFITPELKKYEEKILKAEELINQLEYEIFLKTLNEVLKYTSLLQDISKSIAVLDCLVSLASLAEREGYIKPKITEEGDVEIEEGRHPVVEKFLDGDPFAPNDVFLNNLDHQLLVITGPNMAGKSVFMRQVALIVLMAQIGSFVPAKKAKIGLVDRIFVRSGASDVISSGLSTFMVEMVETAYILNQVTKNSLVIMDEIGRGTSTYDGISIAWTIAEYLIKKPELAAKTLFATHYHELQLLEDSYPEKIKNYQMAIEEKPDGDPIFLYKIVSGRASHSYALAVAKLAGIPEEVLKKAKIVLSKMEKSSGVLGESSGKIAKERGNKKKSEIEEKIKEVDLDNLTPIEALNVLSDIKKFLE